MRSGRSTDVGARERAGRRVLPARQRSGAATPRRSTLGSPSDEMDAGFDFSFQGSVLGWLSGRGRTVAFDRYLQSRHEVRARTISSRTSSLRMTLPARCTLLDGDKLSFRLAALLQIDDRRHPDDLLRRRGGPAGRRLARQPQRHALGGARDPARRGPAARRGAARGLPAADRPAPRPPRAPVGNHRALVPEGDLLVFARELENDAVVVAVNRGAAQARARFDGRQRGARGRPRRPARPGPARRRAMVRWRSRWRRARRASCRRLGPQAPGRSDGRRRTDPRREAVRRRLGHRGPEPRDPRPGVHGARRSVRLRQVHRAAHDRRPRGDHATATIRIGGRVVNDVPPKDRDIAMVFQSYALYPHMTVRENLEFGLRDPQDVGQAGDRPAGRPRRREILDIAQLLGAQAEAALRAASASASRWAAPSCASRRSSSSTSRSRTSTPSCASRCAPRSRSSSSGSGPPPSTSPTTRSRR